MMIEKNIERERDEYKAALLDERRRRQDLEEQLGPMRVSAIEREQELPVAHPRDVLRSKPSSADDDGE